MTRFQRLALATAVATYVLVVIGGTVRVTNSGLSCPDWPTCHGRLVPTADGHVLIEYFHRLFASLVSVLIVATAVVAWLRHRRDRAIVTLSSVAIGVLLVQIGLGGATVTQKLSPEIVTAHLGTAMLLLATVTLTAMTALARGRPFARPGSVPIAKARAFRTAATVAAAGMYVLLLSGGYTASSGAGTSCSGWPLCNGQVIPDGTRYVHIHFFHRVVVVLVTIAFAVLVWAAMRWLRGDRTAQRMVRDSFGLFILQIFIGALNVWTKLDTPIRVLHLATGAALWTALVLIAWTGFALSRRPVTETVEQRTAEPLAGGRPARGGRSQEAAG